MNVGDQAMFSCECEKSQGIPFWIINDFLYTEDSLPINYHYDFVTSTLIILEVDISMNQSIFQCNIDGTYSRAGTLTVEMIGNSQRKFHCVSLSSYIGNSVSLGVLDTFNATQVLCRPKFQ